MSLFKRKSMEQIVDDMIRWTRGATTKLTDFRVGSKIRTIYEAVGVIVEELYDKVFRTIKKTIEENIYSVIGFNRKPATYANGIARFSRSTVSDKNYVVPAGTVVKTGATQYRAPVRYMTTEDRLLEVGKTFVDVPVACQESGTVGNIGAGDIVEFQNKPTGVESVTNPSAFTNGKEQETKEEQKSRFQDFIEANARGVTHAIEYGASTAELKDAEGIVTERVISQVAIEDLVNKLGQVDVYIWNGVGNASLALKDEVQKIIVGYYDENGQPVYGYRPAGIVTTIYTATIVNVTIKVALTPEDGYTSTDLQPKVEDEVDRYFGKLKLGQTLIQTALEANVKNISGVKDVKVELSTDGGITFTTDNVTATKTDIIVASKPIQYV